jgi:hypothetical protein
LLDWVSRARKPSTKRAYTVLTPAGKPADAARAYLATPTCVQDVDVDALPDEDGWTISTAVSGADGVLTITEPGEP